jgi:phenylpropionate dioxygenase-like ring-hydroxylating dioxygenase large terminal subunit
MLTEQEQREFTETGPGTPAGTYLRSFWQPVALSRDVGATPVRLTIMCEDLVAWREKGQVRLMENRCPHRGTFLHTGRLRGGGLQCAYHGWTFDGSGQCIAQPCEPPQSTFAARVRVPAYPTQEKHGLIFAYMGAGTPPPLPQVEFWDRTDGVHNANYQSWNCNYFQCLENNPDPQHTAFVHLSMKLWTKTVPKFVIEETENGIHMQAIRGDYVRHTYWQLPNRLSILNEYWKPSTHLTTWIVPLDDAHTRTYRYFFTPAATPRAKLMVRAKWKLLQHRLETIVKEDTIVQEGQGVVADRTRERLATSDRGVLILRRLFQQGMRGVAAAPPAPPAPQRHPDSEAQPVGR